MDPHLLRTYVTVARLASFSEAARELGYTQSAVSQHIQALEQDLGAPLLTRRPVLPTAPEVQTLRGDRAGVITAVDAYSVGVAAWRLGAGRARKEDPVQAGAGVVWHARPGDEVTEGEPLFTLLSDEPERFDRALASLEGGYDIAPPGTDHTPGAIVLDRIS